MPVAQDKLTDPGGTPRRVLVVDPHATLRTVLAQRLRQDGHLAAAVATAREALEICQEQSPDLLVSAELLEETSALRLAAQLHCQVMVLTARSGSEPVVALLDAGADFGTMNEDQLAVARRGRVGIVLQAFHLLPTMTALENVAVPLELSGHKDAFALATTALKDVGLDHRLDHYPVELSGGMQKRIGIARAIATDPDVLLMDEPTAGLDPISSNMINDMILDVVGRLGVTVLSVNSDMRGAARTADTAAMLYGGHIIWLGDTASMRDSDNAHVSQFVNSRAEGPIPTIVGV